MCLSPPDFPHDRQNLNRRCWFTTSTGRATTGSDVGSVALPAPAYPAEGGMVPPCTGGRAMELRGAPYGRGVRARRNPMRHVEPSAGTRRLLKKTRSFGSSTWPLDCFVPARFFGRRAWRRKSPRRGSRQEERAVRSVPVPGRRQHDSAASEVSRPLVACRLAVRHAPVHKRLLEACPASHCIRVLRGRLYSLRQSSLAVFSQIWRSAKNAGNRSPGQRG